VIPTGIPEQGWAGQVWPILVAVASWSGLLVVLAVPLVSWLDRGMRAWREHLKVRMILRDAAAGTVVVSQTRRRRSSSTLIVRVGGDDPVPALVERQTR
jgi:hypothetical protein